MKRTYVSHCLYSLNIYYFLQASETYYKCSKNQTYQNNVITAVNGIADDFQIQTCSQCIYSNICCLIIGIIGNFLIQFNHEFIKTKIASNQTSENSSYIRRTAWFVFISRIFR